MPGNLALQKKKKKHCRRDYLLGAFSGLEKKEIQCPTFSLSFAGRGARGTNCKYAQKNPWVGRSWETKGGRRMGQRRRELLFGSAAAAAAAAAVSRGTAFSLFCLSSVWVRGGEGRRTERKGESDKK